MSELPVAIGDSASFTKTVGESDIYGFAGITGDFAAPHVNEAFMQKSQYGTRVAHGALLVGFMSTASAIVATRVIEARDDLTPMSIG
jgi:acyl dehydratase